MEVEVCGLAVEKTVEYCQYIRTNLTQARAVLSPKLFRSQFNTVHISFTTLSKTLLTLFKNAHEQDPCLFLF